jgi:hypothetical protein
MEFPTTIVYLYLYMIVYSTRLEDTKLEFFLLIERKKERERDTCVCDYTKEFLLNILLVIFT